MNRALEDAARAVPERDLTPKQEAFIEAVQVAAVSKAESLTDAAEMLIAAGWSILIRALSPLSALEVFELMSAVLRTQMKDNIQ